MDILNTFKNIYNRKKTHVENSDMKSLSTNMDEKVAIECLLELLEENPISQPEFSVSCAIFQYDEKFFSKMRELRIRNRLASLLTNIYMTAVERGIE